MGHGKIYSGIGGDHAIKIYDLATGVYTSSLLGHNNFVGALAIDKDTLVSGSNDHTIRVWDLRTGTCKATLRGHTSAVVSLAIANKTVASCSWDVDNDIGTIRIWDLETQEWTSTLSADLVSHRHTLHRHTLGHAALAIGYGKLFVAWKHGVIEIFDMMSGAQLSTFTMAHIYPIRNPMAPAVAQGPHVLVSPKYAGVSCLSFNNGKLLLADLRALIKIWDFGATDDAILEEILQLLRTPEDFERLHYSPQEEAFQRFRRIPINVKWEIKGQFSEMHQRPRSPMLDNLHASAYGNYMFWWRDSTPQQKIRAVENYLNTRRRTPVAPLEPIQQDSLDDLPRG